MSKLPLLRICSPPLRLEADWGGIGAYEKTTDFTDHTDQPACTQAAARWRKGLNMRTRRQRAARHDEMATPSKPAQKTARAVEGPWAGAAGNQPRVFGERRRGAELDRNL